MSDAFQTVDRAQLIHQAVEEWQDGCEHTMDEPEDCEICTKALVDKVATISGVSEEQRTILRTFMIKHDVYEHSEELWDALFPKV